MDDLKQLEERMGLKFNDYSLLTRAVTHRSYLNENPEGSLEDNERLEFLGDAVLDFIVGAYLYHRYPEMKEGELTMLRAALVRTETLADFARALSLGKNLRLGYGEAENGGRDRPAILSRHRLSSSGIRRGADSNSARRQIPRQGASV
jgi:ribonuclease-3